MTAGDALRPIEFLPQSIAAISEQKKPPEIAGIVDILKNWYQHERMRRAEELFLKPRTINAQTFYSQGANIFPKEVFGYLDERFTSFDYGVELLVAGVDSTGAHIYSVHNPGVAGCWDSLGFHAIGVGQMHAVQAFVAERYDAACSLVECMYVVYEAKRVAEAAPGVGTDTDMYVIIDGKALSVSQDNVNKLAQVYGDVTEPRKQEIQKALEQLEPEQSDDKREDHNAS